MPKQKRAASDAILAVLKRGPKKGLTATAISERAGVKLSTTRTTLSSLATAGDVVVVGREEPTFGRPANRYVLAFAA